MKELNFEQMEVRSGGAVSNRDCMILGGLTAVAMGSTITGNIGGFFCGLGILATATVQGCFD